MRYETLALEAEDGVATLELARGEALNTMTPAFWREMVAVFREIDERPEIRVVVLASTGRHFTAGLDLGSFGAVFAGLAEGEAGRARERLRRFVLELQESFNVIER